MYVDEAFGAERLKNVPQLAFADADGGFPQKLKDRPSAYAVIRETVFGYDVEDVFRKLFLRHTDGVICAGGTGRAFVTPLKRRQA